MSGAFFYSLLVSLSLSLACLAFCLSLSLFPCQCLIFPLSISLAWSDTCFPNPSGFPLSLDDAKTSKPPFYYYIKQFQRVPPMPLCSSNSFRLNPTRSHNTAVSSPLHSGKERGEFKIYKKFDEANMEDVQSSLILPSSDQSTNYF